MQEQKLSREWLTLTSGGAVRVLFSSAHRARLTPFMQNPHTVGSAAAQLGENPKRLFNHVRRYVSLGLLEPGSLTPRRGRPLKQYRAAARQFYIPFEYAPSADLEALANDLYAPIQKDFHHSLARVVGPHLERAWGQRALLDPQGNLTLKAGPPPDQPHYDVAEFYARDDFPAAWTVWLTARLGPEDAKTLQRVMIRLSKELEREGTAEDAPHLITFGMTTL